MATLDKLLAAKDEVILVKNEVIAQLRATIAERDDVIADLLVRNAKLRHQIEECEKGGEAKTLGHEDQLLDRVLAKPETGVTDEDVDSYERSLMSDHMRGQRAGPSRPATQTDEVEQEYDEDALKDALASLGWTD